ncbi:hypothetical protein COO60DRAFT_1272318 [Scenedesmus sp. NREL 46B-D3]|nr:hypothetical protein COO60DRAFT_1272318 [Scenedesmus sp. NREL 46B-D3]
MATNDPLGGSATCPYSGRQFTNVGLEQLRRALFMFATERAWMERHTPRNLLLALVKEVGELSGIFQWRGELPQGLASSLPQAEQQQLAHALSDVLLYLLRLADVCGVDLGSAALQQLAHNAAK